MRESDNKQDKYIDSIAYKQVKNKAGKGTGDPHGVGFAILSGAIGKASLRRRW